MKKKQIKKNKDFNYEDVTIWVHKKKSKGYVKEVYSKKPELRRVVEMVKVKKGRLLDIGCGGGYVTDCLVKFFPKVKIYGCDISETAIKYAKKYGDHKVSYKLMKKKFPYPSNYFDACLALDVLEHVPDADYFASEVKRVLKKDGLFFGAIPCEGQPLTISWFFNKIGIWQNLTKKHVGHIHPEFTHDYVVKFFEKKGFKTVRKSYSERLPIQLERYFFFMIPKEILELFIGSERVSKYNDSKDIMQQNEGQIPILKIIKKALYKIRDGIKIVDDIDAEYAKNVSITAWKINLLISKK